MAFGSNEIGLLFRASGETSSARKAFSDLKSQVTGDLNAIKNAAGSEFSSVGSSFASLAGPATIAVGAIAGIATAVVGASAALFKFTSDAAEFGSKLYDASIQTGLSAHSISALKLAADSSGSSLDAVSGSVAKLNVLLGNAAAGNEKAQATLEKYGITAKDTNEAFNQAVKVIGEMSSQTDKAAALQALFKDRTGALLPVIDQVNGNFKEYIAQAERLGVVLSEEDLRAADAFGDTLGILGTQAKIAGVKFASELMPMVTQAMGTISEYMAANQGVARAWGQDLADTLRGTAYVAGQTSNAIILGIEGIGKAFGKNQQEAHTWADDVVSEFGKVIAHGGLLFYVLSKLGKAQRKALGPDAEPSTLLTGESAFDFRGGVSPTAVIPKAPKIPKAAKDNSESEAEKARREQERIENARLAAVRVGISQEIAERAAGDAAILADHARSVAIGVMTDGQAMEYRQVLERQFLEFKIKKLEEERKEFAGRAEDEKRIDSELFIARQALEKQSSDARKETAEFEKEQNERAQKLLEAEQKLHEERKKHWKEYIKALQDQDELEQRELDRKTKEYNDSLNRKADKKEGILGKSVITEISTNIDGLETRTANFKKSLEELAVIGGGAIQSLAQGMGNLVQQWVLYGSAGPNAMRKMVASVLAGVAAQAAVLAVMELAYGIAALTPWGFAIYGSPIAHFKAAALFGSVAVGAALTGRGVAGDAFKQETKGAYGSANSGQGQQGRGGTNYSGQKDQVIDTSRNSILGNGLDVRIKLELSEDGFLQFASSNVRRNGLLRGIIQEAAG